MIGLQDEKSGQECAFSAAQWAAIANLALYANRQTVQIDCWF